MLDDRCDVLVESSTRRGAGLAVKARCPLHVNVTAALLDTLSDMQQQMAQLCAELDAECFRRRVDVVRAAQTAPGAEDADPLGTDQTFRIRSSKELKGSGEGNQGGGSREDDQVSRYRHREVVDYHDVLCLAWPADESAAHVAGPATHEAFNGGGGSGGAGAGAETKAETGVLGHVPTPRFPVCHQFSAPLPLESRMSFTILNLTGQRTRYFQPRAGEETRRLQYLRVRFILCIMGTLSPLVLLCGVLLGSFCLTSMLFGELYVQFAKIILSLPVS